jgi:hypothetical protein
MAILIRQKRGMVEVPNVIINWALVASRGSVKYTKQTKIQNYQIIIPYYSFVLIYCVVRRCHRK